MKTSLISNIGLLGLLLFFFSSCEKEEERIIANTDGTGAAFTASATTLTLQKENEADQAITFTWTEADFGFDAATTNTIQLAPAGSNFDNPKEVVIGGGISSRSYTVLEFNALLLSMSLPTGINSTVEARVKSQIAGSDAIAPVYSNVVSMTVNPYTLISFVYVPGGYQSTDPTQDWKPETADSLISPTSNGIYSGVINFPTTVGDDALEFKITPAKNWTVAYGDAGNGKVSTSAPDNLSVPGVGMYRLTINLNENTFTAAKYSWGIIGDATAGGWDAADTDMTYNNGTQTWSLTTDLKAGGLKFRLNDAWDTNYGGANGTLNQSDNNNIQVPAAGTYRITFSLADNAYTLTKL
ncbi:SusE domain-containing protein [Rufibacter sp. XAAS-G3-1]|uniref:SusE domain-containing protein n=1 Tax=Rufibacter sp. XAAS-G3-1 TaxID=2729134 RepID=UPI0015E6456B|nr:SusE domain-containing protein [Rufibacter sp. XAAS-G3-1]